MPTRSLLYLSLFVAGSWLCGGCAGTAPNRTNRQGLSKGRWRTYYDADKKQLFTKGRYRRGRPVGKFEYYNATGALDHAERYCRQGFCEVTYYFPSGQVERRGSAQWLTGKKGARFYWFGPWTRYTETGQVRAVETYTNGSHTATDLYQEGRLTTTEIYKDGQLVETRPVQ